jgi:1-deoxy-D-xylulose-5-phosphate synthase
MKSLNNINSPEDLKKLNQNELTRLCSELREYIIDTVSNKGGHLGSNLGAIELTVALHRFFNSPKDKIVWDVGHQAYAHKILTGRKDEFNTLRCKNGICGFPNIKESEHDAFGVGHSSTSISAALGIATARDLNQEDFEVIAVIGDGAMTGGMAFEGINQLGYMQKKMIVILNDNKMSISANVGALSKSKRIENTKSYQEFSSWMKLLEENYNIPEMPELKKNLKKMTTPGMIFEKLGINYVGPIDGHNIQEITDALKLAKSYKGPVLIHAITTKGKGYSFAEKNASKFHGVSPFTIEDGLPLKKKSTTYTNVFSDTMLDLAKIDNKILGITAAMADGTGLNKLRDNYPDRFFDVGIAEQHAVTFAAGLARQGFKPVVAIYSTFLQRAFDQIIHDVCLQNLPVIFAIDRAGLVGEDGATHHGTFDMSYLRTIPNLVVSAPKDENELRQLLYTASISNKPFSIRYPRGAAIGVGLSSEFKEVEIGKSEFIKTGNEIVLVGIGNTVKLCEDSADNFEDGFATVINARFLKPLDTEIIKEIERVGKAIIVEENSCIGGLYSAISEKTKANVKSISISDCFVEHGNVDILREEQGLCVNSIISEIEKSLKLVDNEV